MNTPPSHPTPILPFRRPSTCLQKDGVVAACRHEECLFQLESCGAACRDGFVRVVRSKLMYRVVFPFELKLGATAAQDGPDGESFCGLQSLPS